VTPSTPRLLPGAPRWALAAAAAAVLADLATALVPAAGGTAVRLGVHAALLLGTARVLRWRARVPSAEQGVWGRVARAVLAFAACSLLGGALALVPGADAAASLVRAAAPLVAAALLYGALVRWNRHSDSLVDPNDSLNGSSAVLVVVAMLEVGIHLHGGDLSRAPWWQVQPLVVQAALAVILTGTTVTLGDAPVTLGRADDSTLVLTDDYASTRHARLVPGGGTWVLEDLGSTNGTYLGGSKVSRPTPVPLGQQIKIGKTVLELRR